MKSYSKIANMVVTRLFKFWGFSLAYFPILYELWCNCRMREQLATFENTEKNTDAERSKKQDKHISLGSSK